MNPPIINDFQCPRIDYADDASQLLRDRITEYGTDLSADHAECLHALIYSYAMMAAGLSSKRIAWPLSVGGGKTVSVAAFVAANMKRSKPYSIMVAQNTIEALCQLKRLMITFGVPEDAIGLVHTKQYDPEQADACRRLEDDTVRTHASEPSIKQTDADQYPILLLSHNLLKSRQDIHEFNQYDDRERDLVVWDESLLKSTGRTMNLSTIREALAVASVRLEDSPDNPADGAIRYLKFAHSELHNEINAQAKDGHAPSEVRLPEKLESEIEAMEVALGSLLAGRQDDRRILTEFLRLTPEPLRVIQVKQQALIKYDLVIPDSLKRIVVLDASYNIRELVNRYDDQIDVIDAYIDIKSFEAVHANRLVHGGGRSSIDPALRESNSGLLKAIVDRLLSFPDTHGTIIFNYMLKPFERRSKRTKSHADLIKAALIKNGVDPEAKLACGRPRFVWLHWGQELGLSNFSYCSHVMAIGIYRKSDQVVAMELAGQMDDLTAPEAGCSKAIREVQNSEIFHSLYQAMGRGQCRVTQDGRALPMSLDWVGLEEFPESFWTDTTPHIRLSIWESSHVTGKQKAASGARAMRKYLNGLSDSIDYVSSRQLKAAAGLSEMAKNTFANARKILVKRPTGWLYSRERQGYQRFG